MTCPDLLAERNQIMEETPSAPYQLCFQSLLHSGRGMVFPCDSLGKVHLDALSERARNDYFYARAMVGRELAPPAVERASNCRVPAAEAQITPCAPSVTMTWRTAPQ